MLYIIIVLILLIAAGLFFYFREKKRQFVIRIGKRGNSVICCEIPYLGEQVIIRQIVEQISSLSDYKSYFVKPKRLELKTDLTVPLPEKSYGFGEITDEISSELFKETKENYSIFLLNEPPENMAKLVVTHDLIVNSAQIPDRELLLESGFIVTVINSSNLMVLTGVRGSFERALMFIFEKLFEMNRDAVIQKM
jgi:hypothetical protein